MRLAQPIETKRKVWLRGVDLNHRPLGYEPNELPDCSTPQFDHSNGCDHRQTGTKLRMKKVRYMMGKRRRPWERRCRPRAPASSLVFRLHERWRTFCRFGASKAR